MKKDMKLWGKGHEIVGNIKWNIPLNIKWDVLG
jgi:hypothetical protein